MFNRSGSRYAESKHLVLLYNLYVIDVVPSSPIEGDSGNLDKARARFTETVDLPTPPTKMFMTFTLGDTVYTAKGRVSSPYPNPHCSWKPLRAVDA